MTTGWMRIGAIAVAGVAVGAVAVALVRGPAATNPEPQPSPTSSVSAAPSIPPDVVAAALEYLEAVKPLAQEGGRVVQHGMKPAVTQLQKPDGEHEEQARLAPSWVQTMTDLRERWAEVTAPGELAEAHAGFLAAWDLYRQAAEALRDASADEARRDELVDEAIAFGERGDDAWNEAAAIAQDLLVAAGEHPLAWLPDPADE